MTEQPRRIPPSERFAGVIAAVVLLAVTAFFVILAVDLGSAASGSSYDPWSHLGIPGGVEQRVALLVAAVVVGVLLIVAGLRLRDPLLRVTVPNGRVTVRAHAVEKELVAALAVDPDVLRSEARVHAHHGELEAQVVVFARPLSDDARLRAEAGERMQEALCAAVGLACARPQVEVRSVPVEHLARYL
jgi:hypothetical protein